MTVPVLLLCVCVCVCEGDALGYYRKCHSVKVTLQVSRLHYRCQSDTTGVNATLQVSG